ncbi:tRNA lysidine(34) synthetase TilS [Neisseria animalis]|uniref:tRNA(Ile)-lysidine synthase n=1 Tax=Neisseria animalis TaxID=492 RepID=A0A5P3MTC3_NEIAN|nr:tRNA lysidine(34) synthetase TilS [Neisseria animalis]QEY24872.1 tRNA lysidine(34) synthetase TilS [Neisseria animalis]ROW32402.1 tRNA lysidine(34) synthetase TilS [Neisseria animalis]VEE08059.1 tRNA(Ile)-lysidine synthetase (tRNA(Ile)-lysidine synthase; tRNA(Ile)-2-lysyl-cytidine synthase) [Neisseria animalis]
MDLFEQFMRGFPKLEDFSRIEVGLSGGLDSVVLLHLLARAARQHRFDLRAVHVHHGLSENADIWAGFCQNLCSRLNIPLRVVRIQIEQDGSGIEAAARKQRYRVFADGLSDIVALAHHQDDQAETFLLAAVRGGGLRGLAAMPVWRNLNSQTRIWRPLLEFGRCDLAAYAEEQGLDYVEDESNADNRFLRNWFRNEVLPHWQLRIPSVQRHILANIRSLQQDLALLDQVIEADYQDICSDGFFDIAKWRASDDLRRRHVLLHFLRSHDVTAPQAVVHEMERVLLQAEQGEWRLPQADIYAYRNRLRLLPKGWEHRLPWTEKPLKGRLQTILQTAGFVLKPHPNGLSEAALHQQGMIRTFHTGDHIAQAYGSKTVGKILQEAHVLPAVRRHWPVLADVSGQHCLAVANFRTDCNQSAEEGWWPVYEPFQAFY